jgi:hypothetical protein
MAGQAVNELVRFLTKKIYEKSRRRCICWTDIGRRQAAVSDRGRNRYRGGPLEFMPESEASVCAVLVLPDTCLNSDPSMITTRRFDAPPGLSLSYQPVPRRGKERSDGQL